MILKQYCFILYPYLRGYKMIIAVSNIKGGVGKSTISANLASIASQKGLDVLLVDADEQKTTVVWNEQREEQQLNNLKLSTIALTGKNIRAELVKMEKKFDVVFVDVGATDSTTQRGVLLASDIALLPFPPRGADLWVAEDVATLIDEIKSVNTDLKAIAFINRADPQGEDNQQAIKYLEKEEFNFISCPYSIGNRKAFANAHTEGLNVTEAKIKDKKAIEEINKLYNYIME